MSNEAVHIIGAGLAGCECAWQLAKRGIPVKLYEQKPHKKTPAQSLDHFAELVCSNSFRGAALTNAVGLLKEEMRRLGSLMIQKADETQVPGGGALCVDRELFSEAMTQAIESEPLIEIIEGDVGQLPKVKYLVIATGPLTEGVLAQEIAALTESERLYFYDSIAPIIEKDSINMDIAFEANRWGEAGEKGDYINCPLEKDQYLAFVRALLEADLVPSKDFEKEIFFEACLPIEVLAKRGPKTLSFGPMKPVGLRDPRNPEKKYAAVVQLRQDNLHASLYNMVGFQTRMKYPDQQRVFRMIPGLENAEFMRLGSMHRNTYIQSPRCLNAALELKKHPGIFFAGQIAGCEGYVESASLGLFVALHLSAKILQDRHLARPDSATALGALLRHVVEADPDHFQPMNVNFGLFTPPEELKHKSKRKELAEHALNLIDSWKKEQLF